MRYSHDFNPYLSIYIICYSMFRMCNIISNEKTHWVSLDVFSTEHRFMSCCNEISNESLLSNNAVDR